MKEHIIKSVENSLYKLPLPVPMEDATHGLMTHYDLVITKVTTEDGVEGFGYTYTTNLAAKAILSVAEDEIKPRVIGKDADRIEQIWLDVFNYLYFVGRGGITSFAQSSLDIALWDIRGKYSGLPLWKLVGGNQGYTNSYGGGVDLNLTPGELVKNVQNYLDNGHKAVKIKVGKKLLASDIERVSAVADYIADDIKLMVDANCGWTTAQACTAAKALEGFGLYWLEEPCMPDNLRAHKRLSEVSAIPIAMGENFRSFYEFDRMLSYGHCDHPQPDVANIGGITAFLKVATLAQFHHLQVSTHGMQEINVSLLSGIANPGYLEIHAFPICDYTKWQVRVENGIALPPSAPGTGIEFDLDRLEQYRIG